MPRIPISQQRVVTGGETNIPKVPVINKQSQAIADVAGRLNKLAVDLTEREIVSRTRAYADNAFSEDLIDLNQKIKEIDMSVADNGEGYADSIQTYIQQKLAQRQQSAPSETAFSLYSDSYMKLGNRTLMQAMNTERKMRTDYDKRKRTQTLNRFSDILVNEPNLNDALEYIEKFTEGISNEIGNTYTNVEALTEIDRGRAQIAKALLDGYETTGQHEQTIAALKDSAEDWKEIVESGGIDSGTVPDVDVAASTRLFDSLTYRVKVARLQSAMQNLKSKKTLEVGRLKSSAADLSAKLRVEGSTQETNPLRSGLVNSVLGNNSIKANESIKLIDDIYLSEAVGNSLKQIRLLRPQDRTDTRIKDIYATEVSNLRENIAQDHIMDLVDLGYSEEEVGKAAVEFNNFTYNQREKDSMYRLLTREAKSDTVELSKKGGEYFYSSDPQIRSFMDTVLNPSEPGKINDESVSNYLRLIDGKYDYYNIPAHERKYLTSPLSRALAQHLQSDITGTLLSADNAMNRIYGLQLSYGEKSRAVFDEMAKNGDLSKHIYGLSQIDPRSRTMAEYLYRIVKDVPDKKTGLPRNLKEIKKDFDGRKADSIELANDLYDDYKLIKQAIKFSDTSGASLNGINALRDLHEIGVQADVVEGMRYTDAYGKWKKALLDPYKVADINGSLAFTKWDTVKYHNDLEEFLTKFSGRNALYNSPIGLSNLLKRKKLSNGIAPDKRWIKQAAELGDSSYASDQLMKRLDSSIWVMNPTYDGLILVHTDTGIKRPFRDVDGKVIEIPYSKLGEFLIDAPKYHRFTSGQSQSPITDMFEAMFGGE